MSFDLLEYLYGRIAQRKGERDSAPSYEGGNGRIDRAVDLILNEDFPRSGALLDVGGATGNLGYALREHFESRTVVDITDECRVPAIAKGNAFYCANIDYEGFIAADGSMDLVVGLDVIEHVVDPERFARECRRVLKPGGRVLINTPNIQYWRHLESLVCDGVFPHTSGDKEVYHGGHLAFYNVNDMCRLFANGFADHRMHTRGLRADPPPPIWTSLMRGGTSLFPASMQLSYADLVFSCRRLP